MLRQIELHGVLADKFGKSFMLAVSTPREACEALGYQIPGFKQFMMTAHQSGLFFAVFNDDSNIGGHELEMQTGASVIRIVPQIVGSGGDSMGWLQVVAGAALIGVGLFVPGAAAFAPALIGAGSGMLIGGVASLLMPVPNLDTQDPDGNKPSYAFGSAVTTVAQGNPVPVLYGRRYVGGFVISAMMVSEDT
ncbi:tail assembly protein [Moraxella osloensis]|uniref:tail assembly protein n=1 Tax=Faucicola osloensis TaxID=34062 RepID=UPI002006B59B|nr:tail assembly protein [Moraxella osloensis]MCK6052521.1 tail assembly protein [Moraxella osloensis]